MSRLDQIEREIANESALGLLLAPYRAVVEVDRRELYINGREIVEKEMSDGTLLVSVGGMQVNQTYWEACGFKRDDV